MNSIKLFLIGILLSFNHIIISQESTITDTIPFELTAHNNISIKAILNKKDTLNLMFHTAANDISLVKESIKNITSIHWDESDNVESWGGESTSRNSSNNLLKIGKFERDSISIWDCENSGPLTDGKFGPSFFPAKIIEIDFDENKLIIHKSLPEKISSFEKLKLIYNNSFMFIEGTSIVGDSAFANNYLIHSGYGGAVLYDDKFVASSKIGAQLEIINEKELRDSYGNILKVKKAKLPTFKIGEMAFKDMPVGFFEGAIARQSMSVLGGDILKRFNIIIDAEREYIYMKPNELSDLAYSDL